MKKIALLFCLSVSLACSAVTPDDLFQKAIQVGKAHGQLTGTLAETLQKQTHSTYPAEMTIEKGPNDSAGCQQFLSTVVQPHVPTRDGKDAGNYVTVNAIKLCPGAADPVTVLVDCKVGTSSCMPAK